MKQYIYEVQKDSKFSNKNSVNRKIKSYAGGIIVTMMLFVLVYNMRNSLAETKEIIQYQIRENVEQRAVHFFIPGFSYTNHGNGKTVEDWIVDQLIVFLPIISYVEESQVDKEEKMDENTIQRILESQANEETLYDENEEQVHSTVPAKTVSTIDMSIEKLRDFDYLLHNFYIVDSATTIGPEQLNVDELLGKSMKIDTSSEGPKVLIFHTHSQEMFVDSVQGDVNTSIVGIGEYLTQLLNAKGIQTIHNTGIYDVINGKLDRSNAYEYAEAAIRKVLAENPSIEVVIDLHRDGVAEGTHLVTEIGGEQTAQIMFFNGLSRTTTNGDIDYLYNPYIQDNLAFSLKMQLACESMYSGFARKIYLRGYRYSLHMMPKSLLIEAGAQTNTVEEMKNAMEVLAEVLCHVLTEDN